jgi:hypothetical protein
LKDARVPALVMPYLVDMDEGVRYAAADALIRCGSEETAREALLVQFVSSTEDSRRIRILIADGFAELGWLVKGHRGEVEKLLPEQFQIDREGHIKRKPDAQKKDS